MGETCTEGCVTSLSFSDTAAQPQAKEYSMHILLALLYVSLVAAPECSCLPTKGDSIRNTIHNILNIAQTTLVHIKKLRTKLPEAPQMEVATPSTEGLTSIISYLRLLDSELQNPAAELLSQIQADVSSLDGRVRSLAQTIGCPIQARTRGQILNHNDSLFPESYLYLSLMKVQRYLEKFLLNKDKLKVC